MKKEQSAYERAQSYSTQEIDLETMNDKQKLLLTQLAYLNIERAGLEKNKDGLTIADLKDYLSDPDSFVYGEPIVGKNATEEMSKVFIGEAYQTDMELLNEMIENGLGDIKITGWVNNPLTGLQAASFQDHAGNTGISYRGSDFDMGGIIGDWGVADFLEYFTDRQHQLPEAQQFFDEKKDPNGNTFIYGHSLGGNLVSYLLLNNPDDVKYAFSFNGNPINPKLLDTPEKVALFQSDKLEFAVVCGDLVGHFKDHGLYSNNVRYIENSGVGRQNPIQAHLPQAASIDKDGNFVHATEEQMLEYMNPQAQGAASWMHDNKSIMNGMADGEIDVIDLCKDFVSGNTRRDEGITEKVINMDDLFRSENSNRDNIDIGLLTNTAGELICAGIKGTVEDVKEFFQNPKAAIDECIDDITDIAQEITSRCDR